MKKKEFAVLRKRLDKDGYTQNLDISCLQLVTKLLDDLQTTKKGIKQFERLHNELKTIHSGESAGVDAMRQEIERLKKENNILHSQVITAQEEKDKEMLQYQKNYGRVDSQKETISLKLTNLQKKNIALEMRNAELEKELKSILSGQSQLQLTKNISRLPNKFENEMIREHADATGILKDKHSK